MLYIRVDANKNIGAGHVMRCIAIAEALKSLKEDSVFITVEPDAMAIIKENGFKCIKINGTWNNLNNEISQLNELIKKNHIEKLLIDSYFITNEYLLSVSEHTRIIYLGSLMVPLKNIKLLINYSSVYDETFYEKNYSNKGTKTLLGVKYAPLRKQFQKLKPIDIDSVNSILLTTGSTDKDNVTLKIINNLLKDEIFRKLKINVIIGTMNNHYNEIYKLKSYYNNVFIHSNVHNMAELIRKNQLVITAAGTTLYELCPCGIPAVSFSIVKEQEKDGIKFDLDGIIPYAGSFANCNQTEEVLTKIKGTLIGFIANTDIRSEKSLCMYQYIDGRGSLRIANAILQLQ